MISVCNHFDSNKIIYKLTIKYYLKTTFSLYQKNMLEYFWKPTFRCAKGLTRKAAQISSVSSFNLQKRHQNKKSYVSVTALCTNPYLNTCSRVDFSFGLLAWAGLSAPSTGFLPEMQKEKREMKPSFEFWDIALP